jgi:hypothetical protein
MGLRAAGSATAFIEWSLARCGMDLLIAIRHLNFALAVMMPSCDDDDNDVVRCVQKADSTFKGRPLHYGQ